ncbi:MFS transporter [Nitrospira sp. Nam80]
MNSRRLDAAQTDQHPSPLPALDQSPNADAGSKSRQYGIRDAAFQAVTQGGGENYFSAFALLLQASPFQIAILSSLPQLIGILFQLLSVKILPYLSGTRQLISFGGIGQALCWIPLLSLPLFLSAHGAWWLILCVVLYVALGNLTVPAWNSLLIGIVDANSRGTYFARRFQMTSLTSFLALGAAGAILNAAERWGFQWIGFIVVFSVAACARALATRYQLNTAQGVTAPIPEAPGGFRHFILCAATPDLRRFLLFSSLMHFSVFIAGPFFVFYMLQDLHLSYLQYAGWMAAGILAQFLTLRPWGQLSDTYGNKTILRLTGFSVPILPVLYLISDAYPFLLMVNFVGGATWAGLSLGLQNYVFDSVRPEERTRGVAVANAVNAGGWFLGAMAGSWLATVIPSQLHILGLTVHPASNLPFLFAISGILRFLVSFSLLGTFREPRSIRLTSPRHIVWELPLVKPLLGLVPWRSFRVPQ